MAENQAVQRVLLSAKKKALYVKYRLTEPIKPILWLLSTGAVQIKSLLEQLGPFVEPDVLQSSD